MDKKNNAHNNKKTNVNVKTMITLDQFKRAAHYDDMVRWFFGWTALFFVCRHVLFRSKTADFSNRFVSIVHALVAIYLSYQSIDFSRMFDRVGEKNTNAETFCMAMSLSYFVYDCLYCVFAFEFDAVVHHVFTIGGLASGVVQKKSGCELVGCLFLMEVSNPSLHLRSLLRELKMKDAPLATFNDLIFAFLFLACRLVLGPPLVYKTLMCKNSDLLVKVGAFGILAVSLLWGWKIVKMFLTKARQLMGVESKRKKKRS